MSCFPLFLSVVLAQRNRAQDLEPLLRALTQVVASLAADYELIVVDNASEDGSIQILKSLTAPGGLPNLQVFALTKAVDPDAAVWVGLENALGDFVAVLDPQVDDAAFLPSMLEQAVRGVDVVFAESTPRPQRSFGYRIYSECFNTLYQWFNGVHLENDAPRFRLLSRRVVNFILQHPLPAITYRHLPATGGFAKVKLSYPAAPRSDAPPQLFETIDRSIRLLVSTTRGPMRMVTALSLFGAVSNLLYSVYVIAIAIWKTEIAPGWVTLSLQQSGMFFLISLVLLVLGEYVLYVTSVTNEGPLYHVAQEFTSAVMTRREKLNVENSEIPSGAQAITGEFAVGSWVRPERSSA